MIISRTPFRISFFGGGTDYPQWYRENGGCVLATTIDKYCYLTCRYLPPFFEHKSRIVYSKIELVKEISEIQHPAVKAILEFLHIDKGVEIHHDGDLPARTGIGSSSSFTVGLLHSLYGLKGIMPSKERLAKEAIYIEQEILKENVGCQDQILAAYGGLNKIVFNKNDTFEVHPVILPKERLELFQKHLMLYFTGFSRYASEIAKKHIENIKKNKSLLYTMQQMVEEGVKILTGNSNILEFGKLLQESWKLKRSLAEGITTSQIDEIYEAGINAGAIGGKLLGAGGGGFILFFAPLELQHKIEEKLKNLLRVKFMFEDLGTQIIFYKEE
jgi:D-glycero-alpha-D-manno-heptose-7-phosphate kinase